MAYYGRPTPRQGPRLTLGSGLGNLTTNTHTNQTVENDQTDAIPIVGNIAGAGALLLGWVKRLKMTDLYIIE